MINKILKFISPKDEPTSVDCKFCEKVLVVHGDPTQIIITVKRSYSIRPHYFCEYGCLWQWMFKNRDQLIKSSIDNIEK